MLMMPAFFSADAHDAGLVCGFWENSLRLMLMMLALFGAMRQPFVGFVGNTCG